VVSPFNMESARQAEEVDLETMREVHATLLEAVRKAQEAVAIQSAQRRYWLEEFASNLTDDGKLIAHSLWKRPVPFRRSKVDTSKRVGAKRKRKDSGSSENKKKARKETAAAKPKKNPRCSPTESEADQSERSYDYNQEPPPQYIPHHPDYQHRQAWGPPAPPTAAAQNLQMMVRTAIQMDSICTYFTYLSLLSKMFY